jgi:hypothetical protein
MKLRIRGEPEKPNEPEVTLWLEMGDGNVLLRGRDQRGRNKTLLSFSPDGLVMRFAGADLDGTFKFDEQGYLVIDQTPNP